MTALKLKRADLDGLLEERPGMRAIVERTAAERLTRAEPAKVLWTEHAPKAAIVPRRAANRSLRINRDAEQSNG